jgi:hypothetical protein
MVAHGTSTRSGTRLHRHALGPRRCRFGRKFSLHVCEEEAQSTGKSRRSSGCAAEARSHLVRLMRIISNLFCAFEQKVFAARVIHTHTWYTKGPRGPTLGAPEGPTIRPHGPPTGPRGSHHWVPWASWPYQGASWVPWASWAHQGAPEGPTIGAPWGPMGPPYRAPIRPHHKGSHMGPWAA